MKTLFAFTLIASAALTFAQDTPQIKKIQMTPEERAERIAKHRAAVYRTTGGMVVKPNSQRGKIRIVTASEGLDNKIVLPHFASFLRSGKFDFDVVSGSAVTIDDALEAKKKLGCEVAVFITDAKFSAPMIAAPEEGWAIVNARSCGSPERAAKESARAFAYIAGAATSTYGVTVMSVQKPQELDMVKTVELPQDVIGRMGKHLATFGVLPELRVTYKNACQEGWAAKPTNDVQKAVWDSVYSLPEQPIKIKYDAKRDAGK